MEIKMQANGEEEKKAATDSLNISNTIREGDFDDFRPSNQYNRHIHTQTHMNAEDNKQVEKCTTQQLDQV